MEVADQWHREWAGTAEYGKVVEGGVTRRIARAMEVLHASGPGSRMKVMRAAYHTTAGPGVPASSYMMHASRRVFSSGFNSAFLEPPSLPAEPLEISSTPLELLQEPHADTENYKVTEPDDLEISEPSKWRSSTGGSMRMPSEESSSTDNASIIDVSRNHKSVFRKFSCDSENSDIPLSGRSSRVSPLLDAPALSTLKFKSLLNGNNDWNNRRKSYSFEDASPLSETMVHSNDTLAMESSTDSGICKSTEIVNDQADENTCIRYFGSKERSDHTRDNTFESWLSKNKQNNHYKGTKFKTYRDHDAPDEDQSKINNITLQPTGKVTITLPITLETEQEYETRKNYEEHQRKFKKVEFCKTELHFAAETGKVNIIATDEKPPPSNDFRKRRSAFVPMRDMPEKPITLFGEKTNDFSNESNSLSYTLSEFNETDENTAATKSILKNKIPKPKPYLLGENMAFGAHDEPKVDDGDDISYVPTAVSLINKQLQAEKRSVGEISTSFSRQHTVSTKSNAFRTTIQSPTEAITSKKETYDFESGKAQKVVRIHDERSKFGSAKRTFHITRSPTPARLKTRELRESDLTYFGVDNASKNIDKPRHSKPLEMNEDPALHDLFQSVRLIQQVSNSVCNSESDDAPEYQNIPMNSNYVPKPTPRIRSKYDDKPNHIDEIVLSPITEQAHDDITTYRRSKLRKHEELSPMKNRSRSEPCKPHKLNSIDKTGQVDQSPRSTKKHFTTKNEMQHQIHAAKTPANRASAITNDINRIYGNLKNSIEQNTKETNYKTCNNSNPIVPRIHDSSITKAHRKIDATKSNTSQDSNNKVLHKPRLINEEKNNTTFERKKQSLKRNTDKQQSDKGDKSHFSRQKAHSEVSNNTGTNKSSESKTSYKQTSLTPDKKEHRSRSLQKPSKTISEGVKSDVERVTTSKSINDSSEKSSASDLKLHKRQSSKDKSSTRNDIVTIIPKVGKDSSGNKITYNKDPATRHGSRPSRREYVINYDDKNGTVSSICKIRSRSGSTRRKGTKEVVKEKFKENLKTKSSDKAALRK